MLFWVTTPGLEGSFKDSSDVARQGSNTSSSKWFVLFLGPYTKDATIISAPCLVLPPFLGPYTLSYPKTLNPKRYSKDPIIQVGNKPGPSLEKCSVFSPKVLGQL